MAPSVVASSLKTAIFTAKMMELLGYKTVPASNEKRADIVQTIEFGNEQDLVKYVQGIQAGSAVDSASVPMPWDMPGYTDKVIMAAGAFTMGSSIELSCDAPIREPFIAFQQGGLTYEYGKLGVLRAIQNMR
jgi:cystathionine beta-lyase family protein involved in aluminum resistance